MQNRHETQREQYGCPSESGKNIYIAKGGILKSLKRFTKLDGTTSACMEAPFPRLSILPRRKLRARSGLATVLMS
eukprot:2844245-Pleurochrysis_carterae.AAC.2